jgi:hypothetical protein
LLEFLFAFPQVFHPFLFWVLIDSLFLFSS